MRKADDADDTGVAGTARPSAPALPSRAARSRSRSAPGRRRRHRGCRASVDSGFSTEWSSRRASSRVRVDHGALPRRACRAMRSRDRRRASRRRRIPAWCPARRDSRPRAPATPLTRGRRGGRTGAIRCAESRRSARAAIAHVERPVAGVARAATSRRCPVNGSMPSTATPRIPRGSVTTRTPTMVRFVVAPRSTPQASATCPARRRRRRCRALRAARRRRFGAVASNSRHERAAAPMRSGRAPSCRVLRQHGHARLRPKRSDTARAVGQRSRRGRRCSAPPAASCRAHAAAYSIFSPRNMRDIDGRVRSAGLGAPRCRSLPAAARAAPRRPPARPARPARAREHRAERRDAERCRPSTRTTRPATRLTRPTKRATNSLAGPMIEVLGACLPARRCPGSSRRCGRTPPSPLPGRAST